MDWIWQNDLGQNDFLEEDWKIVIVVCSPVTALPHEAFCVLDHLALPNLRRFS